MNQTQNTTDTKPRAAFDPSAIVNVLREVGAAWAETGVGIGRIALESSAKALERTAKSLLVIEEKLHQEAKAAEKGEPAKDAASAEPEGPVTKRPADDKPAA